VSVNIIFSDCILKKTQKKLILFVMQKMFFCFCFAINWFWMFYVLWFKFYS